MQLAVGKVSECNRAQIGSKVIVPNIRHVSSGERFVCVNLREVLVLSPHGHRVIDRPAERHHHRERQGTLTSNFGMREMFALFFEM